jgi:hypothetical protein
MTSMLATSAVRLTTWRLGGRARKTVLLFHIMAAGTWFGLDIAMAVLVFTAIFTESAEVRAHTLSHCVLSRCGRCSLRRCSA